MTARRVTRAVVGAIAGLLGLVLLIAGIGLLSVQAARDTDGYVRSVSFGLSSDNYAVTVQDIDLTVDPGTFARMPMLGDLTARVTVRPDSAGQPVFVGIAPEADVDGYLTGVAHEQLATVTDDGATYHHVTGEHAPPPPPETQGVWVASSAGDGPQTLTWNVESGRWAVVVMNADASPGVAVSATAGVRAGPLTPIGVTLLVLGLFGIGGAVALLIAAVRDTGNGRPDRRR